VRVLDRGAARRFHTEPAGRLEVHVRRGLAAPDLLGRHRRGEVPREAREVQDSVDQRSVRGGRDRERPPRRQPLDRFARAGDQWQALAVPRLHPPHDLGRDLIRLLGNAQLVVHVPGPLQGAHPHHGALRLVVVPRPALLREPGAHLIPELLRLDEHAVEVEDDCLDHAERYSPPT
jgi:hypothetical protein